MTTLKTITAAALMVGLAGYKQAVPQTDKYDFIMAAIAHYKMDSGVLVYTLTSDDNPVIKDCRAKGWPNTEDCRGVALGMITTLQRYLENKIPEVPRPPMPAAKSGGRE